MRDEFYKIVEHGKNLGAEYIEVRAEKVFRTSLTTKDGKVVTLWIRVENVKVAG